MIENPTLKALSGSLNNFSLYSSFTYRAGSLKKPFGAERPNIANEEESPSLVNISGNLGLKYRLSQTDNLSLQLGLYSTTPFHSSISTNDKRVERDFKENHQNLDVDDPTINYFKTYNLGAVQNITFLKYQYVTRSIYRDYGLRSGISLSHAFAYKFSKLFYIAASLTYENYHYDKNVALYLGQEISLLPYQVKHKFRGNISSELYLRKNISFRLMTDLFSLFRLRRKNTLEKRRLKQTVAMTYFFNRDVSVSPNVRFILDDFKLNKTNVGLSATVNM